MLKLSIRRAAPAALLLLLTLLAYLPALRAGYIWDDDYYVTRNFNLRSGQGLVDLWTRLGAVPQYYPVTHTTFWLEYHLWGLRPVGYHADNILLHAMSVILLWRILRGLNVPGAWIAAAVFAVHPVHVESVAWVTERKNVLSGVLYLATALVYLRWMGIGRSGFGDRGSGIGSDEEEPVPPTLHSPETRDPNPETRSTFLYLASLALFALALLSKSVAASLPAALLLITWWKRGRIGVRDIVPLLPMFVMGLAMGALTSHMEREYVGAWGPEWNFSWADRILIAGRAVWFYAWKLIWPTNLTFIYPRWKIDPHATWQWLFPLAAIGLVLSAGAFTRKRAEAGRGLVVALLFFGGTLVPALGFVNLLPMRYSFVADHFQYLASIGLITLIVAAGVRWSSRTGPAMGRVIAAVILIALGAMTFHQALAYKDIRTLWIDTIAKNPGAWMARNNYASLLLLEGDLDGAEAQLRAALAIDQNNPEVLTNLGMLFEARSRAPDAIGSYLAALQLGRNDASAQYHLGRLLISRGNVEQGLFYLNQSIENHPNFAPSRRELGRVLLSQGKLDQAIQQFQRAAELDLDSPAAENDLASALMRAGRLDEAETRLKNLVARFPDSAIAYNNLGIVLEIRGDLAGAIDAYENALRIAQSLDEARRNLDRARGKASASPSVPAATGATPPAGVAAPAK